MIDVSFKEANRNDSSDLIFVDKSGKEYHLYSDARCFEVKGLSPDFWDKFYFCKKIKIDHQSKDSIEVVTQVLSYK